MANPTPHPEKPSVATQAIPAGSWAEDEAFGATRADKAATQADDMDGFSMGAWGNATPPPADPAAETPPLIAPPGSYRPDGTGEGLRKSTGDDDDDGRPVFLTDVNDLLA